MKAHFVNGGCDHRPEQQKHCASCRAKDARRNFGPQIGHPAAKEGEYHREYHTVGKLADAIIENRETVGDEGDHGGHAHQVGEDIFNDRDACGYLYRPAAELFFAKAGATTAVGYPAHHLAIHRRDDHHAKNSHPDARAKSDLGNTGYDDELEEWTKHIKRRTRWVATAAEGAFK